MLKWRRLVIAKGSRLVIFLYLLRIILSLVECRSSPGPMGPISSYSIYRVQFIYLMDLWRNFTSVRLNTKGNENRVLQILSLLREGQKNLKIQFIIKRKVKRILKFSLLLKEKVKRILGFGLSLKGRPNEF